MDYYKLTIENIKKIFEVLREPIKEILFENSGIIKFISTHNNLISFNKITFNKNELYKAVLELKRQKKYEIKETKSLLSLNKYIKINQNLDSYESVVINKRDFYVLRAYDSRQKKAIVCFKKLKFDITVTYVDVGFNCFVTNAYYLELKDESIVFKNLYKSKKRITNCEYEQVNNVEFKDNKVYINSKLVDIDPEDLLKYDEKLPEYYNFKTNDYITNGLINNSLFYIKPNYSIPKKLHYCTVDLGDYTLEVFELKSILFLKESNTYIKEFTGNFLYNELSQSNLYLTGGYRYDFANQEDIIILNERIFFVNSGLSYNGSYEKFLQEVQGSSSSAMLSNLKKYNLIKKLRG